MHKPSPELIRGIGLIGLMASVFNCTVGGGIFKLPSSVYSIVGDLSPLVYVICFLVMSLVAGVFVQVGSRIRSSGGAYAYVQPVLGPFPGFISGVLLWALATLAMASVASAYSSFVAALFPVFSSDLSRKFVVVFTLFGLGALNIRGVKTGATVGVVLSILKILPLLLLGFVGLLSLDHSPLTAIIEKTQGDLPWEGLMRSSLLLIFAFTGIESALIPSGEIDQPEKNLPRALYGGLILILVLYLSIQISSQAILGSELAKPESFPLAVAGERLFGPTGDLLLKVGAVLSTLGYLSAVTLSIPRSLYALAKDGYLPEVISRIDQKFHTPYAAILTQVVVTGTLAISNQFESLAILANLSAILMYILCTIAALRMKKGGFATTIAILALLSMLALLTAVTRTEWIAVVSFLLLSSGLYAYRR
ncbi:MAG: APC family permease [Bdellovibrionales bacterium]|nr:APC family permease [Bdellovibrionales bacterium]